MNGILLYVTEIQYFNKNGNRFAWIYRKAVRLRLLHQLPKIRIFMYNAILNTFDCFEFKPSTHHRRNEKSCAERRLFPNGVEVDFPKIVVKIAHNYGGMKSYECGLNLLFLWRWRSWRVKVSERKCCGTAYKKHFTVRYDKDGDERPWYNPTYQKYAWQWQ